MNKTWGENMVILTKLLILYVSNFICTFIHELGHFLVAMQLGVNVKELILGYYQSERIINLRKEMC